MQFCKVCCLRVFIFQVTDLFIAVGNAFLVFLTSLQSCVTKNLRPKKSDCFSQQNPSPLPTNFRGNLFKRIQKLNLELSRINTRTQKKGDNLVCRNCLYLLVFTSIIKEYMRPTSPSAKKDFRHSKLSSTARGGGARGWGLGGQTRRAGPCHKHSFQRKPG